ncbi:MFS transporter [Variovorax ginsengisoli]|uniref:MFS family arabinose efflux permease n=1 Tax=Variovorax ginsengisoli TaxID=363844 RepID=A0ABT9S8B8_9BURK|nr:MFS transporter [Variovorax ginsengisoli]MDP9900154.1 putative MFS family arabinose efflux permease [Variovorax ginsengisoli]
MHSPDNTDSCVPLRRPHRRASAFARLAGANLAAQSAEQLSLAAVPLVAVLLLDAGPGTIGLLATVQTLPFLLLSMPLGVLADRVSKRRLMVAAEALRALALLGLLLAVLSGGLSVTWLGVLGFIGAIGTVGFSVAAPALLPALVARDALAHCNGRLELARSAAFAAGPAVAGALVAWGGATSAFVLATVLSATAVALLLRIAEPAPDPAAQVHARHPLTEVREGAALIWQHPMLRPVLLTAVVWNIAWFVLQAAYVTYAVHGLGLDARGVGLTLAAYGAGMVVGALLASRITTALPFGRAVQLGPAVSVLAAGLMAATLAVPSGALAALAFFLFGAGPIVWTITSTTLRQSVTPHGKLGCVSALFLTVNAGARPVGAALGALVGARWGAPACFWLALAGFALQAVVVFASPLRGLARLPATPDLQPGTPL